MKISSLLCAISDIPKWAIMMIIAVAAIILILIFFRVLYVAVCQPGLRDELQQVVEQYNQQKTEILDRQRKLGQEQKAKEKLNTNAPGYKRRLSDTERIRLELIAQGANDEEARTISSMSLEQLIILKSKHIHDYSDNYIINTITRRVLIDTYFEQRKDVDDFKVPVNKTTTFTSDMLGDFVSVLSGVSHQKKGKPAMDMYSVNNKSFAMIINKQNGFLLKVKCGTFFGQRLAQLYPMFFSKAKFPSGMLWFDVYNRNGCSIELMKLMLIISYNIAKAGY